MMKRRPLRGYTLIEMLLVVAILAIIGLILLNWSNGSGSGISQISNENFNRFMVQEGISNAQNTGYQFNGCSDSENVHVGFTGVKNGVFVTGVICQDSAWGKGTTIRYF